jgi:hypothetical protein
MTGDSLGTSLDDELLGRIRNVVAQGEVIETLTNKRPNRIVRGGTRWRVGRDIEIRRG